MDHLRIRLFLKVSRQVVLEDDGFVVLVKYSNQSYDWNFVIRLLCVDIVRGLDHIDMYVYNSTDE